MHQNEYLSVLRRRTFFNSVNSSSPFSIYFVITKIHIESMTNQSFHISLLDDVTVRIDEAFKVFYIGLRFIIFCQ